MLEIVLVSLVVVTKSIFFFILELVSYRNVTDSFKATFKKRPGNKHLVQQAMMLVMLLYMMAGTGEMYIQFMYTKRMFQWQMDRYSYFGMIEVVVYQNYPEYKKICLESK